MFGGTENYRDLLRREYRRRIETRGSYSLSSFANFLGLNGSRLSHILQGKDGLSRASAERVCDRLGLSGESREFFFDSVEALHARSAVDRTKAEQRLLKKTRVPTPLPDDAYEALSNWRHLALIEVLGGNFHGNDLAKAAELLRCTRAELDAMLDRLERLNLIERFDDEEEIRVLESFTASPPERASEARRKLQHELIEQAARALKLPVEERGIFCAVMSLARKDLPRAKDRIARFLEDMVREFGDAADRDGVYALNVQLFDLLKKDSP